ncbi:MAG TPA: cobalamin-independent methionine synthase II family protein [Hyphomicrobiaceae bacterium]|nr:cobalamin-independent methionine synthase II family protein [Hyphomicrobiaceae bacterium]
MPRIARADVVGSLLRPQYLLDARNAWREGKATGTEVHAAEDRAVAEAIALQEAAGLDAITDGEYRRYNFMATMGVRDARDGCLSGFATLEADAGWMRLWLNPDGSEGGLIKTERGPRSLVVDRIKPSRDAVAEEFPFAAGHAKKARVKLTYPAPSMHRIAWEPEHSSAAYPTAREFLLDVRDHVRAVVKQLVALGCDYVQLDAPNYSQWHIDPRIRGKFAAWGRDLDKELIEDAEIDNSVFDGITGITRAIHLCRGNAPGGRYLADGGYGGIAAELFPRLTNYDTLLLEYDTPRAGDFSPLAHVRPDTTVVLGLITTKDGRLEDDAAVERRIREASAYVPLERLALSPQCGFASGEYATTMTHAQQEAKLRLVGRVAAKVWPNG